MSISKKKNEVRVHVSRKPLTAIALIMSATDPLPTNHTPAVPVGFDPAINAGRGNAPRRVQIELAPKVAYELQTVPDYAAQFGKSAPDASQLAGGLKIARAWNDELTLAEAWVTYVRYQTRVAWKQSDVGMTALQKQFQALRQRDPSLAERYPSLAAFFDARLGKSRRPKKAAPPAPVKPAA
jgi:hypothetical protein